MSNEWLQKLKEGDEVYVSQRSGISIADIVKRVTPTQIVTKYGKFQRHNGHRVGGDVWSSGYLIQATDDIKAQFGLLVLRNKVKNLLEKITIPKDKEKLHQLIEAIKPFIGGGTLEDGG